MIIKIFKIQFLIQLCITDIESNFQNVHLKLTIYCHINILKFIYTVNGRKFTFRVYFDISIV